ncbi:uncharacterized protein LOC122661787 [Telopea speciosissima]|uniref:uncharacterized protein LOC122661787 n=1 Tax=Telopea speciosissima TaxID=54955 RepID=UPI001CC52F4E|nr:uncharacterized protein LOC122661787 [Telopea speciosissima]
MPQRISNGGNEITTLRRSPRFLPREDASGKEPEVWKNRVSSSRNLSANEPAVLLSMPQRSSNGGNEITILRRSPRFFPREDASGKEPEVWKNRVSSSRNLSANKTHSRSPLSSIENTLPRKNRVCSLSTAGAVKIHSDSILSPTATVSLEKTHECYSENITKRSIRSSGLRETSAKPLNGSRKCTSRISVSEIFPSLRRSPRFSNNEITPAFVDNKAGNNQAELLVCRKGNDFLDKKISSEVTQKGNLGKNRSRNVGVQRVFSKAAGKVDKGVNSFNDLAKYREGIEREISTVSPAMTPKGMGGEKRSDLRNEGIRVDRKRKQRDEGCSPEGWTKEQEAALRRAFFAAKPTPHFWKKVSKLVTGKSAQECFDKVHSDLITPPHPQPRSRANRTNSSPLGQFSISASKLLEPTEMNVKRQKNSKQKSHLKQKAVRHLLRKHYLVDQISEVDLSSCQKNLASPPVLKQVKNMALHEKYIDQLHCREARRKAASSSVVKHIITGYDGKENHMQETDGVEIARNSLISDAQDMINKFKCLQAADGLSNNDDYDEDEEGDEFP